MPIRAGMSQVFHYLQALTNIFAMIKDETHWHRYTVRDLETSLSTVLIFPVYLVMPHMLLQPVSFLVMTSCGNAGYIAY